MKFSILIFALSVPIVMQAQNQGTATMDIIKDPLNKNREFRIIHNADSTLGSQGFMIKGKKDGAWRTYPQRGGTIVKLEEYCNGVLNGAVVSFNSSGVVEKIETYLNNKLLEIPIRDTIIFKDELNAGREYTIINGADSNVIMQGFMENGKEDGVWLKYQNSGGSLSNIEEYNKGVINGASVTVLWSTVVTLDETLLNDTLEGIRFTMYNGGRLRISENYKKGRTHGNKKIYSESGALLEDGNWKNGQRTGINRWYRNDGSLYIESTYIDGDLQGTMKEYDAKGWPKLLGQYNKNNESGEWLEFKDSSLVRRIIYKNGKVVKEIEVRK